MIGNPYSFTGPRTQADEVAEFFNTAAFAKVAAGVPYGNAVTWNVAALKDFPLPFREGMRLQFRTDFFNLFNQVNFNDPNLTFTNVNFGKITGAASPRIMQFGLKLIF